MSLKQSLKHLSNCQKIQNKLGVNEFFKIKHDSNDNIEQYKARLVAKNYTQKDDIDYIKKKKTFLLVSKKNSLRTIIALVVYYDIKLRQMDVKITFLNGDLEGKKLY